MRAKNDDREGEIQSILKTGLQGLWYAVSPSSWVTSTPIALTRLGEDLVVWRDEKGSAHVLENRCPHRGARLSLGQVKGCHIACGYHGVELDGDGVIQSVPAFPSAPLVGRKAIKSYPITERSGCIWAYFGDDEPSPFDIPEDLVEDEWKGFLTTATWKCNYQYVYDNLIDPMHGSYLHAASHTLAWGSKEDRMRTRETERGFIIEREGQKSVNFDWTEFVDSGAHWFRLDIPYPAKAGPGGMFRIIGFVTPIDEDRTQVFFWRMRKVSGWQLDMWRFLFKSRWEERHWVPLEQDRTMLEGLPKDHKPNEMLYQHDLGVARLRKILEQAARERLKLGVKSQPQQQEAR